MKLRQGFVSNSSSSSFIVAKEHLKEDQQTALLAYGSLEGSDGFNDGWSIWEDGSFIKGWCVIDNGHVDRFLDSIEADKQFFEWDD